MAQVMRVTVDGKSHEFDMERLTFAEGRAIERVSGMPMSELGKGTPSLTMVQALVWVALKRDDTRLQFSDLDDRAIADFGLEQLDDEDEAPASDPTSADPAA